MKPIEAIIQSPAFNYNEIPVGSFITVENLEDGELKHGVISNVSPQSITYSGINVKTKKFLSQQKVTINMFTGTKYKVKILLGDEYNE